MKVKHPQKNFSGVSYGLVFQKGVANTQNTAHIARLTRLGFEVEQEPVKADKAPKRGDLEA